MAKIVFAGAVPPDVIVEGDGLAFGWAGGTCDRRTVQGWAFRVDDQPDGSVVARYQFLDYEGRVRARGPRDAVLAVLATARPDWRGDDVIALVQLWEPK